ncbi:MAG: GxxExxY protein [Chloroflexi bacterium]|nr:GxxExxY protein [Chloroflexota bacterium]
MGDAERLNQITEAIIGAAIEVHRALWPGLMESAYEPCLAYELVQRGWKVAQQVPLPVVYKNVHLDCAYRLDLLVEDLVIVEIKAVKSIEPIHKAQLLSYLKLSGLHVGLLVNFNVTVLKNGIVRMVNDFPKSSLSGSSPRTLRSPWTAGQAAVKKAFTAEHAKNAEN